MTTDDASTSGADAAGGTPSSDSVAPAAPMLRVVKGEPSAEELAALVAVIAARSGGSDDDASAPRSAWIDRSRLVRRSLTPGPGAWRGSALPH